MTISSENLKKEWLGWWQSLNIAKKIVPLFLLLSYGVTLNHLHGLRGDLIVSALMPTIL